MTATYLGVKGTRGVQEFLPNTYPIGAYNPCPSCPLGFEYRTSGGDSTRESGQLQLRRRLRAGFTASLLYTYSKSIDDDAFPRRPGPRHCHFGKASSNANPPRNPRHLHRAELARPARRACALHLRPASPPQPAGAIHHRPGRGRRYSPDRLARQSCYKEWTLLTNITIGTGMPETPSYLGAVPGTGFLHHSPQPHRRAHLQLPAQRQHLNVAAYAAPAAGQWGTAGRDSITGPASSALTPRSSAPSAPPPSSISLRASTPPTCSITPYSPVGSPPSTARNSACLRRQSHAQPASHDKVEVLAMRILTSLPLFWPQRWSALSRARSRLARTSRPMHRRATRSP
jgi:hypothetical protein